MAYSNKTHKLAPDGKTAYVKNSDGSVSLWRNGKFVKKYPANSSQARNIYKRWNSYGDYTRRNLDTRAKENGTGSGTSTGTGSGTGSSDTGTSDGSTSTESESVTEYKWVQKTVEEPITTYEEAVKVGKLEVNKARRNNGHAIECKVLGSNKFKEGEWALVQIPSFEINDYMYITKVDNSLNASDEWVTGLTLVDYPPSISSGESNKYEEEEDDNTSDVDGSDVTGSTSTSGSTNSSGGVSSSRSSSSNGRSSSRSSRSGGTRRQRVQSSYSGTSTTSGNTGSGTQGNITGGNSSSKSNYNPTQGATGGNWGKNLISQGAAFLRKLFGR